MFFKTSLTLFSIKIFKTEPVIVRKSLKIISKYQKLTNSSLSSNVSGWRPPLAKYAAVSYNEHKQEYLVHLKNVA